VYVRSKRGPHLLLPRPQLQEGAMCGRFGRGGRRAARTINRFGMPTAAELQSSNDMIFSILAWPSAQARRAKIRNIGYGVRSDFELNFGRYLPAFGRADGDDAHTQPD